LLNWRPGQAVSLRSRRFEIRSLDRRDATPKLLGWLTDAALMHYLNGPRPLKSLEDLVRFIGGYDNRTLFMLGLFHQGELVGFFWVEVAPGDRNARTHHVIGERRLWGSSAALEARAAILDWLFATGIKRAFGSPMAVCRSAIAGYRRQGFTYEGTFKSASLHHDGSRSDIAFFRMLPEEWQRQKATKGALGRRKDAIGKVPPVAQDIALPD